MPEPQTYPADDAAQAHGGQTQSIAASQAATGGDVMPLPTTAPPSPSERYALLDEIARGGMGVIYRATDTVLGREVAVKVLQEKYAPASGVARRFADEARITGQLQHPAIPAVHDLGVLPDGRPFLAMKLIKGETLEELLKSRADPAEGRGRFVAAFEQVCQAVAYAHAHGVLHRDLKPANVMVGAFGEVQLMDWGLAKVLASRERERPEADPQETVAGTRVVSLRESDGSFTQAGSVLGTPAFMPPEQAVGAVGKVDQRSDVFGLGAVLAVILTGQAPFAASSAETTRVKAAQGDVAECLARLDASGAEPELVALCKRCLSPKPADRPGDGGEVARAVAGLRAAADERARRAELDKVRVEGEKLATKARALERRKRRRLWAGAAAALAVAAFGGLGAVLAVQRQANADLEAKNQELAERQAEVEDRFRLAQQAIATFHTGVSKEALLKNEDLKKLRTKLLRQAAGFYGDLEKLLRGKADPKSRRLLAEGYYQLAELTDKIGDKKEALALHRQALKLRRELAASGGADAAVQLELTRSLHAVGHALAATGKHAAALVTFAEARDLAVALEIASPTDAVREAVALGHYNIGLVLSETGRPGEALAAYKKARAIRQKLAEARPTALDCQRQLASSHNSIGAVLAETGKPGEALAAYEKAREVSQKLADAARAVADYQSELAKVHNSIGAVLMDRLHKPGEALRAFKKACDIQQRLAGANPAVNTYQSDLAKYHCNIGIVLTYTGDPEEGVKEYEMARDIQQRLADANPAVLLFQSDLARTHNNMATLLMNRLHKPAEALAAFRKALAIKQKLADASPTVTQFQGDLARSHYNIGVVLWRTGKRLEALQAWKKARDLQQKLADANPTVTQFQGDLAKTHNSIGNLLSNMGSTAEALAAWEKARDIYQKLADASPGVPRLQIDLARSQHNIGAALADLGKPAEALAAFRKARDIQQRLVDASPAVGQFRSDLGHAYHSICQVLSDQGALAEALAACEKARDIRQKLAEARPTSLDYQRQLAASQIFLGLLHARRKHFPEAFAALDASQTISQKLGDANQLARSHACRGWAHVGAGRPAEAATDLRRAIELWAKEKARDNMLRFEQSHALALLAGLGKEAKSGLTAAEAASYADQAVAALGDAIAAGWGHIAKLKEPAFDSLRQRDDFRNLVKKLEARAANRAGLDKKPQSDKK
jgi:tetratricopeptide (TPR) repeat protein